MILFWAARTKRERNGRHREVLSISRAAEQARQAFPKKVAQRSSLTLVKLPGLDRKGGESSQVLAQHRPAPSMEHSSEVVLQWKPRVRFIGLTCHLLLHPGGALAS